MTTRQIIPKKLTFKKLKIMENQTFFQILYWVSFVVTIGFAVIAKLVFKATSLSEMYYILGRWYKGGERFFQAWCVLPAFTLLPVWLEYTPEKWQFLPFLACAALIGVACAPKFLHEDRILHFVSAAITALCAILGCFLGGVWWLPLIFIVGTAAWIIATKRLDDVYWGEITAIACVFVSVGLMVYGVI